MSESRVGLVTGRTFRARRRIAAWFAANHAISAAEAVSYAPQNAGEREAFADLRARRIVQAAGEGRYFMLLDVYDAYEAARRERMVPFVVGIAVAIAAFVLIFYRSG